MTIQILVVDDERAILFAMREYFAAYGYGVDCALDKYEAQALLKERVYAVLITDLRLSANGDTDGLDIAACAIKHNPAIRCILLTAYGTPEIQRKAAQIGVSACLSKPRPLDEILETVVRLLEAPDPVRS